MAIRNFDGVDDRIVFSGIGADVANGAFSIVGLVRPTALNTGEAFITLRSSGAGVLALGDSGTGKLGVFTDTLDVNAIANLTAGDHQLIAATKPAGTSVVRFHRKVLGSGGWTHVNSGGTHPNVPGVVDEVVIGGFSPSNTTAVKDFDGSWFAVFTTELSDTDIEAIQTIATSQFLYDLGAIDLWNLNQASTATNVSDEIGDADQSTITGTAVITGSDPTWNFGITVPPPLDFSVRLSGGSANADPSVSIGGAVSSVSAPPDIFDNVSNPERVSGVVDYRLVYVHNDDAEDGSVIAYLPSPLESGREMAIGVPTQAAGVQVTAITNDTTAPAGVTFSAPVNAGSAVSLGVIPAGSYRGLWMRRTTASGTVVDPTNFGKVRLELSRTT